MENATEALYIAFAMIVFVGALSLCILTFSEAKAASEFVLYATDDTNYYDFVDGQDEVDRIVGIETIIPTLYRYYKESYTVIFRDANGKELELYKTENMDWVSENEAELKADNRNTNGWIGRFDIAEESVRGEMWTGNPNKDCKLHLDALVYGKKFLNPNGNTASFIDYKLGINGLTGGFLAKYKDKLFYETLGEYEYERDADGNVGEVSTTITVDGEEINLVKKDTKRVITYTLKNN